MPAPKKAPPKEEAKRPVMSWGPYPTDRNTSLEIATWANEIQGDDTTFTTYNVTVKRSYRADSGEWKQNQNFRPHDIPVLIHALNQAYSWILEEKNHAKSED